MKPKLIDILTMSYLLFASAVIMMFYQKVEQWMFYMFGHFLYALMIFLVCILHAKYPANNVVRFFRYNYSLLALGFIYKSLEGYILSFHAEFKDPVLMRFEDCLFTVTPTLWLEKIIHPVLTEFFYLNYFSYYFYMLVPALVLNIKKRFLDLDKFVFMISLTFYMSCLGFIAFPVEGPIYTLKAFLTPPELSGYAFVPLQQFLMYHGDPHGTCFPSSHVAICWVALFMIRHLFARKWFWIIFPFAVFLTLSVVYNRYHYVSDAVAGLIWAYLCFNLGKWLLAIKTFKV